MWSPIASANTRDWAPRLRSSSESRSPTSIGGRAPRRSGSLQARTCLVAAAALVLLSSRARPAPCALCAPRRPSPARPFRAASSTALAASAQSSPPPPPAELPAKIGARSKASPRSKDPGPDDEGRVLGAPRRACASGSFDGHRLHHRRELAWTYRDPILAWLWKPFADRGARRIPWRSCAELRRASDAFKPYLKLSLTGGPLFSAPVIFYELWSVHRAGPLQEREEGHHPLRLLLHLVLFVGGGLFGWRVAFPVTFSYFLSLAGAAKGAGVNIRPVMMMNEYLDFVSQMLARVRHRVRAAALSSCSCRSSASSTTCSSFRFGRWFVLVAFTIGAVITPPDTTSQIVMSIPLCVLYFVSIGLAYVFGKRPSKEEIDRFARRASTEKRRSVVKEGARRRAAPPQESRTKRPNAYAREEEKKKKEG